MLSYQMDNLACNNLFLFLEFPKQVFNEEFMGWKFYRSCIFIKLEHIIFGAFPVTQGFWKNRAVYLFSSMVHRKLIMEIHNYFAIHLDI
jgi:hypothetical protein